MTTADGAAGYRYFTAYGQMEWRMNNLMPDEEARLLGRAYAAVAIFGTPNLGDTITFTFTGGGLLSAHNLVVTAPATQGDPNLDRLALTQQVAVSALQDATLISAGFFVVAPYGQGPFSGRIFPEPTVAFTNPTAFKMTISFTPEIAAQVQSNGSLLTPLYIANKGTQQQSNIYGYLNILDTLEGDQASTTENLDTIKADVWTARSDEIRQREMLYRQWRQKLSIYLGIPMGEYVFQKMGMRGSLISRV